MSTVSHIYSESHIEIYEDLSEQQPRKIHCVFIADGKEINFSMDREHIIRFLHEIQEQSKFFMDLNPYRKGK